MRWGERLFYKASGLCIALQCLLLKFNHMTLQTVWYHNVRSALEVMCKIYIYSRSLGVEMTLACEINSSVEVQRKRVIFKYY